MQEEFKSLQDNETWELAPFPSGRKLMQCKWAYRTKVVADGFGIKYKSSLASKFFSRVKGAEYIETFAPIAKMDSMRLVLAIVASKR